MDMRFPYTLATRQLLTDAVACNQLCMNKFQNKPKTIFLLTMCSYRISLYMNFCERSSLIRLLLYRSYSYRSRSRFDTFNCFYVFVFQRFSSFRCFTTSTLFNQFVGRTLILWYMIKRKHFGFFYFISFF